MNKKENYLRLILLVVCFCLYINTLFNKYCLDDTMMITENTITQKGFEGIKEHLSHSFLYGFLHQEGINAASSHWRPLSLITYSIETGLCGSNKPGYSHLINVLIYSSIVLLLFSLFYKCFLLDIWLSFFAALLFSIHPIHTEVVANIKGRDEMLCLLFVLLALHQLWHFIINKKIMHYLLAILFYFVSLTAKETSITFIVGIPVMLYFFCNLTSKSILVYSSGFVIALIAFILIRNYIVPLSNVKPSQEIMNNPFLYAVGWEAICTKIYVLLLYLKMLVFPHPLSYDYSYNQIHYVNGSNSMVWVSILIYMLFLGLALHGFKKKSVYSFSVILFFTTFSIATNFVLETGIVIGERMLFVPSIFVMILIAAGGNKIINWLEMKFNIGKAILVCLIVIPIFTASAIKTISRNKEWKDDTTLNLADVKKSPQSAKLNSGAGGACLSLASNLAINKYQKDSLLLASIQFYKKTLAIHPRYYDAFLNMGIAYSNMDSLMKAEECWDELRKYNPSHPKMNDCDRYLTISFFKLGEKYAKENKPDSAIFNLSKAVLYTRQNDSIALESLYSLGGMYYLKGDYEQAHQTLGKLMKINPNYRQVSTGYNASEQELRKKRDVK